MTTKSNVGEFCWNELITPDVAKAKTFYGALLGWTFQEHDMGYMTYTMAKSGDKDAGGMMTVPGNKAVPPHWMSYINVEDVEEVAAKAESLGGKVVMPVTMAGDFGKFVVVQDPTGAHISFWQSLKDGAC